MLTRGDMHWNLSNARYEVPKGSNKLSVFASALWIGGIDENGELQTAAQTYRQAGIDFYPGPIEGLNTSFDSVSCQRYNLIWKINKDKVEEFITNYQNGKVGNGTYKIKDDFLTWPATGNGAVTGSLTPFHDHNPVTKYHNYNYLKSLNCDSTSVAGVGGYVSNFIYNGQPYSGNFPLPATWIPSDIRFLIGSGPFRLHAGEVGCHEFAYVFTRNTSGPNGLNTSITTNIAALQTAEAFYRDSLHSSCYNFPLPVNDQQKQNFILCAYPNPVTGILKLNLSDSIKQATYLISDLWGRKTMSGIYSPAGINVSRLQQGFYLLQLKRALNGRRLSL